MIEYGLEWSSLDSYFSFTELSATPDFTPEADHIFLYAKDDGAGVSTLCYKNDAGTEVCLPSSGSFVTGIGIADRLALWATISALDSDADLTFNRALNRLSTVSLVASELTLGSVLFASTGGLVSQDNANLFWDDSNNRLGLGTAVPGFQFHGIAPNAASFNFTLETYGTGPTPNYRGRAARGTLASPSSLQADDLALSISALPYAGSDFASGARAQINFLAGENLSATNQGTYIVFRTTPTGGSTTIAERFRIGPAGQLGIGGATFGSSGQVLTSGGASAAPSWTTIASSTNALLDASNHTDTVAQAVTRGSMIYGNSTPKWDELVIGSAGAFLRNDGTDVQWSTLILPNAATVNRVVFASATNTYGESADVTYDGTDFAIGSGKRFRMQSQNRTRYLNTEARVYKTGGSQSISNNTFTAVTFDAEDFDTDTLHDNTTNNSRITIAITGKYHITATARWEINGLGERVNSIRKNAVATDLIVGSVRGNGVSRDRVDCSGTLVLTAGDYIELYVLQDSGISLNVEASGEETSLEAIYVGE